LDNAVRHSPDGGEIVVTVEAGSVARCRVVDQGPGFTPDFIERAFDRFSRHDANRVRQMGGAGLGLAIARSYINALNGSIWVESGPGGLVSFSIPNGTPTRTADLSGRGSSSRDLG
jgi:signal transduction histidine kinase